MQQCPHCHTSLMIASADYISEMGSTEVYVEQLLVCNNSRCDMYCESFETPKHVISTNRVKLGKDETKEVKKNG